MQVFSNLKFRGSAPIFDVLSDFPESPVEGQMVLVNGVIYIWSKIDGVTTWYPLSDKTSNFIHAQGAEATTWEIKHNLNTSDFVFFVYDNNNNLMQAQYEYVDNNQFNINFSVAKKGKVVVFTASQRFAPVLSSLLDEVKTKKIVNGNTGDVAFNLTTDGKIEFNGDLIPTNTDTFSIGSSDKQIKELFVSADTIYLSDKVRLTGNKLEFANEAGEFFAIEFDGTKDSEKFVFPGNAEIYKGSEKFTAGSGTPRVITPELSIPTEVNEKSTTSVSISNYDDSVTYHISSTRGTISNITGSSFDYIAYDITDETDGTDTISIYASKQSWLDSETATYDVTVKVLPPVDDDSIVVVDFTNEASSNDGYDLV